VEPLRRVTRPASAVVDQLGLALAGTLKVLDLAASSAESLVQELAGFFRTILNDDDAVDMQASVVVVFERERIRRNVAEDLLELPVDLLGEGSLRAVSVGRRVGQRLNLPLRQIGREGVAMMMLGDLVGGTVDLDLSGLRPGLLVVVDRRLGGAAWAGCVVVRRDNWAIVCAVML
jgi:hypothetical protein